MTRLYHRPVDLLEGVAARQALDEERALPLAGGGICFRSVEVLDRSGGMDRVPVSRWSQAWPDVAARITSQRGELAGVSLDRPRVMGVLNLTPDSFSDGGRLNQHSDLIARARQMVEEGADFWDVGGESTRPGSDPVSAEEETGRVLGAIESLVKEGGLPVSIDSRKPEVFEKAIGVGAKIINDVSALTWSGASLEIAAELNAPVILMHALGDPKTMQDEPLYDNVLLDVYDWLEARIEACEAIGIDRTGLVVDPGIGFGKTLDHNLSLLRGLSLFHGLGCPVLLGASRKSFIPALHGPPRSKTGPEARVGGSVASVLAARSQGVQIFRVHDVHETVEALAVAGAIARAK